MSPGASLTQAFSGSTVYAWLTSGGHQWWTTMCSCLQERCTGKLVLFHQNPHGWRIGGYRLPFSDISGWYPSCWACLGWNLRQSVSLKALIIPIQLNRSSTPRCSPFQVTRPRPIKSSNSWAASASSSWAHACARGVAARRTGGSISRSAHLNDYIHPRTSIGILSLRRHLTIQPSIRSSNLYQSPKY